MRLLHTEASNGWGGQEIRILKESIALREKGYEIFFAVQKEGKLVTKAKEAGFSVVEIDFSKKAYPLTLLRLVALLKKEKIDLVVTHSSADSWIAAFAAKCAKRKVVRVRHLSTKIKPGLNSYLLYNVLVDYVVTTSECVIPMLHAQSGLEKEKIACVPTGVDPAAMQGPSEKVKEFKKKFGLKDSHLLVGTVCVVRSWKGIEDLLQAAFLLKESHPHLRFLVIGGGYLDRYIPLAKEFNVEDRVFFTGHLDDPIPALAALDIFVLLSTANEGISQASLQAAYLEKPLITTSVGGLPEVCIDKVTGFVVPPHSPQEVADKIQLLHDETLRKSLGKEGKKRVEEKFLFEKTIHHMASIYSNLQKSYEHP